MQPWVESFFDLIGGDLNGDELNIAQMVIRTMIVFVIGVTLVRLGKRRFYGQHTPLDLLLAIIVGSVLSRAINGSARFSESVAAALTLIVMHWLFVTLTFYSERFNTLVTGGDRTLIQDGLYRWEAMRASKIGRTDLEMVLRQHGVEDVSEVKQACLERSGDISVIRWEKGRLRDEESEEGDRGLPGPPLHP